MAKKGLTRRKLLAAAAPLAAVPIVGKLALDGSAEAGRARPFQPHGTPPSATSRAPWVTPP